MPVLGNKSKEKLATVHPDLKKVCEEAIKYYDFTVIYGQRTVAEQQELFKKGRVLRDGKWVKVGSTVTNLDGVNKKSMHNYSPSLAVDLAPYPIDWNNIQRFKELAVIVKQSAKKLGINLVWGGDWKSFKDYPHFELKLK
jgi:peptidoglycan LD-endopeptidase CwlK